MTQRSLSLKNLEDLDEESTPEEDDEEELDESALPYWMDLNS